MEIQLYTIALFIFQGTTLDIRFIQKNIMVIYCLGINNLIPFDPINNFINKADLFSFLGQKINDIEKSQLEKLYTNYKIRFVILKKKMENYVVEENGYFLYDLKTINK